MAIIFWNCFGLFCKYWVAGAMEIKFLINRPMPPPRLPLPPPPSEDVLSFGFVDHPCILSHLHCPCYTSCTRLYEEIQFVPLCLIPIWFIIPCLTIGLTTLNLLIYKEIYHGFCSLWSWTWSRPSMCLLMCWKSASSDCSAAIIYCSSYWWRTRDFSFRSEFWNKLARL